MSDDWREGLAAAGLDSIDALMATTAGECVSSHKRGQVWRLTVAGRPLYLKRDLSTLLPQILRDLLAWQWPEPSSVREREGFALLAAAGIRAARPVAWGQKRSLGLPDRGAILMTAVEGTPLGPYLRATSDAGLRRDALRAAGEAIGRIYRAGLSWPDLRAKHIYIVPGRDAGLIDLARLHPTRSPARCMRKQLARFLPEVQAVCPSNAEAQILLGAIGIV